MQGDSTRPDTGVRCMLLRGGTSKGAYFLAEDLPADPGERDQLLLRILGSPDPRQIDGIGGAHPLTSKIAVVSASARPEPDVEYLFLQAGVEEAFISDGQNCGKLTLISPPRHGGSISTRTFIPHRGHDAIGALGAVSVATGLFDPRYGRLRAERSASSRPGGRA